jgi:excisionase family DNA binding protein
MPVIRRKLADAAPKLSATPKTRPVVVIAKPKQQSVVGAWKPNDSQRLLSVKEAAKYLGSSPWHIRRAFREGDFPRIRWGRRDMVDRADLDAFIEKMKAA